MKVYVSKKKDGFLNTELFIPYISLDQHLQIDHDVSNIIEVDIIGEM